MSGLVKKEEPAIKVFCKKTRETFEILVKQRELSIQQVKSLKNLLDEGHQLKKRYPSYDQHEEFEQLFNKLSVNLERLYQNIQVTIAKMLSSLTHGTARSQSFNDDLCIVLELTHNKTLAGAILGAILAKSLLDDSGGRLEKAATSVLAQDVSDEVKKELWSTKSRSSKEKISCVFATHLSLKLSALQITDQTTLQFTQESTC